MPPVLAYVPAPDADLLTDYDAHCTRLGLTRNTWPLAVSEP